MHPPSNSTTNQGEVTSLLLEWSQGDELARDRLVVAIYEELHRRAQRIMYGERREHTMGPSALVHEAFLRVINRPHMHWQNRAHFLATAARTMRRILVDHARARAAEKRGGGWERMTIDLSDSLPARDPLDVADVNAAIEELTALDEQQARIVDLRFFGGLSIAETAEAMQISPASVKREWQMARAWLSRRLGPATRTAPG
jgi:RNA polymerase sigma-70 factor (ECF subfamily)